MLKAESGNGDRNGIWLSCTETNDRAHCMLADTSVVTLDCYLCYVMHALITVTVVIPLVIPVVLSLV